MKRLVVLSLLLSTAPCAADVVKLHNGRIIEGVVVHEDEHIVRVEFHAGAIELPRAQVLAIERRATQAERVSDALRASGGSDPEAVGRVALLAEAIGEAQSAAQLRALAAGLRLEERVEGLRSSLDPEAHYSLALWSRNQNYSLEVQRCLVGRVLKLDPRHVAARRLQHTVEREAALSAEADEGKEAEEESGGTVVVIERQRQRPQPVQPQMGCAEPTPDCDRNAQEFARLQRSLDCERAALAAQRRDYAQAQVWYGSPRVIVNPRRHVQVYVEQRATPPRTIIAQPPIRQQNNHFDSSRRVRNGRP